MTDIARKWSLAVVACAFLSGCFGGGEDHPEVFPISGTVMYQGAPVANAQVAFWAEGASKAASGVTDANGKFQLSMYGANDGALPGEHTVLVTKTEGGAAAAPLSNEDILNNPQAMAQMSATQNAGDNATPANALPAKYATQESSDLRVTVAAGDNDPVVITLVD